MTSLAEAIWLPFERCSERMGDSESKPTMLRHLKAFFMNFLQKKLPWTRLWRFSKLTKAPIKIRNSIGRINSNGAWAQIIPIRTNLTNSDCVSPLVKSHQTLAHITNLTFLGMNNWGKIYAAYIPFIEIRDGFRYFVTSDADEATQSHPVCKHCGLENDDYVFTDWQGNDHFPPVQRDERLTILTTMCLTLTHPIGSNLISVCVCICGLCVRTTVHLLIAMRTTYVKSVHRPICFCLPLYLGYHMRKVDNHFLFNDKTVFHRNRFLGCTTGS